MFQLRANKLAKAQAAAKHQGSQRCSNCGHTSSPKGKQQRQAQRSTKAHKGVPSTVLYSFRSNLKLCYLKSNGNGRVFQGCHATARPLHLLNTCAESLHIILVLIPETVAVALAELESLVKIPSEKEEFNG